MVSQVKSAAFDIGIIGLINSISGIEFHNHFISPGMFAEDNWDILSEVALQLPIAILPVRSTHPVTWLVLGTIRIPLTLVVMCTLTWWLALTGLVAGYLTRSWNEMRTR